ncbi:hypothetical protein LINPERPRIM_LOCUS25133, partial [Linum perenne]
METRRTRWRWRRGGRGGDGDAADEVEMETRRTRWRRGGGPVAESDSVLNKSEQRRGREGREVGMKRMERRRKRK